LEQLQLNANNKRSLENSNELISVKMPKQNSFVKSIETQRQNFMNNKFASKEINTFRQNRDNLVEHENKNKYENKVKF